MIGELVVQDHPAVGHGRAAVAEVHLDAFEHLGAGDVRGDGEHVDGQDMHPVIPSGGKEAK